MTTQTNYRNKTVDRWKQLRAAAFRASLEGKFTEALAWNRKCDEEYKLLHRAPDHGKPDPDGNDVQCWFPDCEVCSVNWWEKAHKFGYKERCQFNRCQLCSPTWLGPEEHAYPHGAMRRQGVAIIKPNPHNPIELPYEMLGNVIAGIPDTAFTIPARLLLDRGPRRIKGYLTPWHPDNYTMNGSFYVFIPSPDREKCIRCADGEGCKRDSDFVTSVKVRCNADDNR